MNNLADPAELGLKHKVIVALQGQLAATPNLRQAVLFGSRAKGNYRPGSDIDIALFGEQLTAQQLLALEHRLDELLLPYQIDLCHVDTLQNTALLEHIQRVGIVLFKRTKD